MLSPKALGQVFGLDPDAAVQRWQALTPRECEVAEHMARGLPNPAIAELLEISPKTLDIHRGNLKKKLGAVTPGGVAVVYFLVQLMSLIEES